MGRRIAKLLPNGSNWDRTDYYYSAGWQVLEERFAENQADPDTVASDPRYQYVWGMRYVHAPVLRDEDTDADGDCTDDAGSERLYYTQDANFNVTALVETDGTVAERYTYDPYGTRTIHDDDWSDEVSWANSEKNEILFTGHRLDAETGLYYCLARHYHPALGRWLQRDPIGYGDGMSLFEYAASQPGGALDPYGLFSEGDLTREPGAIDKADVSKRNDWVTAGAFAALYWWRVQFFGLFRGELDDWFMGFSTDEVYFDADYFKTNKEVRAFVDDKMSRFVNHMCKAEDLPYTKTIRNRRTSFRFNESPMRNTLGTGMISADFFGRVWFDAQCPKTCKRVFVLSMWRWDDKAKLMSWESAKKHGYTQNPLLAVVFAVEHSAHWLFDSVIGANYHYHIVWPEILSGCCEDFAEE